MRKLLLSLSFWLGLCGFAAAQCVGAGNPNVSPQPGAGCASEPTVTTYAASSINLAPAAAATDIACINGSATRIIRLQYIRLSGSASTAFVVPVKITKNASLDTGGTLATGGALPVPYAMNSADAAPTATTSAFTVNPTIADSAPGVIDSGNLTLTTTGTATGAAPYTLFDYAERNYSEAPILRTAAQQICVNLVANTVSSGQVNVSFKWTEQAQ